MTEWRPDARCPNCGRSPNVNFSEREVRRARKERQAARVTSVTCQKCKHKYWIRAAQIAAATPDPATNGVIPPDFPDRDAIVAAGIQTLSALMNTSNLEQIKGIGPARARRIREALDVVESVP